MTGMLTGTYLTRCLVISTGIGIILGDVQTGLIMGAAGELAFLGFGVSSGGAVPPNPAGPGIMGTIIAITLKDQGVDVGTALACSFPFAILIQFLITGIYTVSAMLAGMAERAVLQGRYGRFRILANGTLIMFVLLGFLLGLLASWQAEGLQQIVLAVPAWLTHGLGTAGKMLPAVGFAVILHVMAGRETIPFVLLGYLAAAYLGMPAPGIALLAVMVLLLIYRKNLFSGGFRAEGTWLAADGNPEAGGKPETDKNQDPACFRIPDRQLKRLSRKTALRAYILQNGYNYASYQGLSYANIMYPALKELCPEDAELRTELHDSMGYCSVNPHFLPILTGIQLVTMNQGMKSRESRDIRLALMGPLAGIGDSLIQFCFAPVFSTVGASMAQAGMIAGPAVFLLGMNSLLFGMKLFSEATGYRLGLSLTNQLREHFDHISNAARMMGTAVIAGLVVQYVDISLKVAYQGAGQSGLNLQEALNRLMPGILPVSYTALLFYLLHSRGWSIYRLIGLTLCIGILL